MARAKRSSLDALGIGIVIDDSAPAIGPHIPPAPADRPVKIDQSFVRDLTVDPDDAAS